MRNPTIRAWFSALLSVLILIGLTALTWWVVQTQRPPGAMTPLEAQGMDMSVMKPPRGAFPVGVEEVQPRMFLPTVTYPATIRAYNEEIIRARIMGKLLNTFVYPGDRVRPGQLLALIEPTEYEVRVQEAAGNVQAARSVLEEARARTAEAESELQVSAARRQQMEAQWEEARSALQAVEAELKAAQASLDEARARIRTAQAELDYWQAEAERLKALLQKGFVSKRDSQMAETRWRQAQEELSAAQAASRAQQERVHQLRANREAMQARLRQAEAALQATEREIQAAQARLRAARAQQQSAEAQLKAQQSSAQAAQLQVAYTRLTALNPGIITERLTEPGTLVEPGTPILKLQNTTQVRVQAQVAAVDAYRLQTGYPAWIKRAAEPSRTYTARISAIFHEAQPGTRTMRVESLLPNPEGRFTVGEYAEMRIGLLPRPTNALTVPLRALQYDEFRRPYLWVLQKAPPRSSHTPTRYTCPMHPHIEQDHPGTCPICKMDLVPKERPAEYIARKRWVQAGLTDGARVQILKGLKAGEKVIVFGFNSLVEGDPVFPTEWTAQGPRALTPPSFTPSTPGGQGHQGH